MPSTRLKSVYNSAMWRNTIRPFCLRRAGYRCEHRDPQTRDRCRKTDRKIGGSESLTIDHTRDDVDVFDVRFLKVLCHEHHGKKDGGRQFVNGQRRS